MATEQETDYMYMQVACAHSKISKAVRAKVGACLVTTQGVILGGVNGTPRGMDNTCENKVEGAEGAILVTKPEVIHAELQCILKAAREGVSCVDSSMYITLSPCEPCAAMMIQAGIRRVRYLTQYRNTEGINLLKKAGIDVRQADNPTTLSEMQCCA